MMSVAFPSNFFFFSVKKKKKKTWKMCLLFQRSSGRTPNFSLHQLSSFKCIKAIQAVQPTEWNVVVLFILLQIISVSGEEV